MYLTQKITNKCRFSKLLTNQFKFLPNNSRNKLLNNKRNSHQTALNGQKRNNFTIFTHL